MRRIAISLILLLTACDDGADRSEPTSVIDPAPSGSACEAGVMFRARADQWAGDTGESVQDGCKLGGALVQSMTDRRTAAHFELGCLEQTCDGEGELDADFPPGSQPMPVEDPIGSGEGAACSFCATDSGEDLACLELLDPDGAC